MFWCILLASDHGEFFFDGFVTVVEFWATKEGELFFSESLVLDEIGNELVDVQIDDGLFLDFLRLGLRLVLLPQLFDQVPGELREVVFVGQAAPVVCDFSPHGFQRRSWRLQCPELGRL